MGYRHERKSKTSPDGTSEDYQLTERTDNGLLTLFLIPIGLTTTAVVCWLILQIGVRIGTAINPPKTDRPSYVVIQK